MNFEKDKIIAQLDKIVSDKTFSRSKINVRLLRFLVEATLNNEDIKETIIGIKFFGSNYDPVKSDNKVRVYVYHLRKKLDDYYSKHQNPDDIVFRIAKGQYKVAFEKYTKPVQKKNLRSSLKYGLLGVVGLCFSFLLFVKKPVNIFWKDLIQNDFPTTMLFGNYFTIEGAIPTRGIGIMRDYQINSPQELEKFITKHPEYKNKLRPSRHYYFNWMAPYCSKIMTEFWTENDHHFGIGQVTEWGVSKLGKENVVYFGQSKAMGVLKNILVENFPHYTYGSQVIRRVDPITKVKTEYRDVINYSDKITDYTIVAKINMPTGSEMRFFLSDQDCGAISALEYFTQKDSVDAFYNRHGLTKNEDFLALFKVTGWHRKSYDMEFLLIDKK
ncbi:hypothetical protein MHTCC0001_00610 [Flavobacteriaceae bacterium MHTCC 0001]